MSTHRKLLYGLLAVFTVLRLLLIGRVELSPDEAYYTMWSQHPDLSYYSKGPGVAATIWVSTHLFGVNEFGVRFFSPLLALGTSLLMFHFARRLYGEEIGFWTVLTLNCLPICQVGALLMTIDPLSLFFWIAAMTTFWRALETTPGSRFWWVATGACIGLGFLCKWTNAIQLISIVGLLAATRRYRREFREGGFWLMLGVFALFTLPPIVWNAQNAWITVEHLLARGGLEKPAPLSLSALGEFLGGQLLVYSPLIFLGLGYALWEGTLRARNHFKPRFLLAFAAPIVVLYGLLALRQAGEPNWTVPAVLSLTILGVVLWHELAASRPWARRLGWSALALGAVLSVVVLDLDAIRALGIDYPYDMDPSARLRGWRSSAELVERFRHDFEAKSGRPVFLIGNRYQTSAALGFYFADKRLEGPGHPSVYIPESQAIENQFSFWKRYDGMEDLETVAADSLAGAPEGLRAELREALTVLEKANANRGQEKASAIPNARRKVVQMLLKIRPNLPLDESFVEEQGVSLFYGRDALYLTDRAEERPPSAIKGGFERVELIGCIDLQRRKLPLRQWRIFACYNYHGMSL